MNIFSLFNKTIAFLLASIPLVYAQNPNIRSNQVGFYPYAAKIAVWVGNKFESFYLFDAISKDTVFKGKLSSQRVNAISQKSTQIADFSAFTKSGKYFLSIPEIGVSHIFEIKTNVHRDAATAALKATAAVVTLRGDRLADKVKPLKEGDVYQKAPSIRPSPPAA